MSSIIQFLASLAGGLTALAIILLLSRQSRQRLVVYVGMAVGIAFVLPVRSRLFQEADHPLLVVVLLGMLFAGAGSCVGILVDRLLKTRRNHG